MKEKIDGFRPNYEGNHSLLFLKRLKNEDFIKELVNILYKDFRDRYQDVSVFTYLSEEKIKKINKTEKELKEILLKELLNRIDKIYRKVNIEYSDLGYLDSCAIFNDFVKIFSLKNPEKLINGEKGGFKIQNHKETILTKSIAESHEIGHFLRTFSKNSSIGQELLSPFKFELKYFGKYIKDRKKVEEMLRYFARPDEIIERMAQIRNYFGMKYGDKFTKNHLEYLMENYVKDTGIYEMQIKPFFDSIVDKEKFLEIINNYPV